MAVTKIRGNTQIMDLTITNTQISASAGIETSKLADGAEFIQRDGSVAFTGEQSMGNNKLTNLAAPTNSNDAARLVDVQNATAGLDVKTSVRAATTAAGTLSTDYENGDTLDGVILATGDRILIKDQSTASENGIYTVNASGAPTRATDFDEDSEVTANAFTFVAEGTTNADTGWVVTTDDPITVGTTAINWTQFSGAGAGDVNNASNVGAGEGIFKQLNGDTLEFRSLDEAASGKVTVTTNGDEIEFDIGAGTLVDADINASAAISRSKIAAGTADHVIINDGSGNLSSEAVLSVSRGGTGSGTALNNNRVMISSGGAIIEHAAITASRALVSNVNGLPEASSVTTTELGYVSGVTSSIQTQLDGKLTETLTDGNILVGDATNVASSVTMSGDATISNTGVLTISSDFTKNADFVDRETPSGTIDGANTTFTLANTPVAGSEHVYLNGLLQEDGAGNDYTISGDTITYLSAPQSGDTLRVSYRK